MATFGGALLDMSQGVGVALYQVHYEGEDEPVDLGGVTVRLRVYRDGQPVGRLKVSVGHRDILGLPAGVDEGNLRFLAAMAAVGGRELEDRIRSAQWPSSDWSVVPNIALPIGRVLQRLDDPAAMADLDAAPAVCHEFMR